MSAAYFIPGSLRVETRTEMPACEETILKLFEAGLVDWVGIEVEGALPFLFTRAAVCPVCHQEHTWFVLRGDVRSQDSGGPVNYTGPETGEVRCAACDKLQGGA